MVIVFGLVSLLGFFALGYGIIAAAIVTSLAKAYVYNTLSDHSEASVPQPDVPEPNTSVYTTPGPSEGILASHQVTTDNAEEVIANQNVS
jgi:hypothetical protein